MAGPQDGRASDVLDDERLMDDAVDLAVELVRLDTVNPGLVPGAAGEGPAVRLVAERLTGAGFDCRVSAPPQAPHRPSLVARHGGPGPAVLLNGHLDTVGSAGMAEPFAGRVDGDRRTGRLFGRGACDMKAGVAALVAAAEAVARVAPDAAVVLALVADEEDASLGTSAVLADLGAAGALPAVCLVGEPTWLDLAVAHRGFAVMEVELRGRAAHSSRPTDGINALTHLGRLLTAVERADRQLASGPLHPLLGPGSLLATVAAGGSSPFVVPDRARVTVERRTLPGQDGAGAVAELERIVAGLAAEDSTVDATVRLRAERSAWEQSGGPAERLAAYLAQELTASSGREPARVGAPYWMESALWQAAGVPTVVCGPAGGGLHADVEWVELAQVRAYAVAVARSLLRLAGG